MKALDELEKVAGWMPRARISFHYHYILGFRPVGRSTSKPIDEELLGLGETYKGKS
jgi:hypothetical protein